MERVDLGRLARLDLNELLELVAQFEDYIDRLTKENNDFRAEEKERERNDKTEK